jgi:hypothetical protein
VVEPECDLREHTTGRRNRRSFGVCDRNTFRNNHLYSHRNGQRRHRKFLDYRDSSGGNRLRRGW